MGRLYSCGLFFDHPLPLKWVKTTPSLTAAFFMNDSDPEYGSNPNFSHTSLQQVDSLTTNCKISLVYFLVGIIAVPFNPLLLS